LQSGERFGLSAIALKVILTRCPTLFLLDGEKESE